MKTRQWLFTLFAAMNINSAYADNVTNVNVLNNANYTKAQIGLQQGNPNDIDEEKRYWDRKINAERNFKHLKLIKGAQPNLPAAFLQHPMAGQVLFWLDVDETGHVTNAHIRQSSGMYDLDVAAQNAVMQFVYEPYIDPESGKAKAVHEQLMFNYHP